MNRGAESRRWRSGVDVGLLVLRLGMGLSMFLIFGLPKLQAAVAYWHTGQWQFVDFNRKVALPAPVLCAYLQSLNESVVALFLAAGFLARYAAASLAFGFAVATACSLKAQEPQWLFAAYFCLIFLSLAFTGPGRFSLDTVWLSKRAARFIPSPSTQ